VAVSRVTPVGMGRRCGRGHSAPSDRQRRFRRLLLLARATKAIPVYEDHSGYWAPGTVADYAAAPVMRSNSARSAGSGSHTAAALDRTCSGLEAPDITEATLGWAASQPMATWSRDNSRSSA